MVRQLHITLTSACLAIVLCWQTSNAAPALKTHSQLNHALYLGDTIELQAQATGEQPQYRWFRGGELLCQKATCLIETSTWQIGTHVVTLIVYDSSGSQGLEFRVRALAQDPGRPSQRIEPESISFDPDDHASSLAAEDFYVYGFQGVGDAYDERNVSVLGHVARRLRWNERLRTQTTGILRFGRRQQEEFFLGRAAEVRLSTTNSGHRMVHLEKGAMRARSFDVEHQNWSLTVGTWLQIDVDANSDIVIEHSSDSFDRDVISLSIFRGRAKVFQKSATGAPSEVMPSGLEHEVVSGFSKTFREGFSPESTSLLRERDSLKWLRKTSPHLLSASLLREPYHLEHEIELVSKRFDDGATENRAAAAKMALEKNDAVLALELLTPVVRQNTDSKELLFYLASAYHHLGLLSRAKRFYRRAIQIDRSYGAPHFALGEIAIRKQKWDIATRHFVVAQQDVTFTSDTLFYYLGVSFHYRGVWSSAQRAFESCIATSGLAEVVASCREFLDVMAVDKRYRLQGALGVLYDSNVQRRPTAAIDPEIANAGMGYQASFDAWWRALRGKNWHLDLSYGIARRFYLDRRQKNFQTIEQNFSFPSGIAFGGDQQKALFTLGFRPYVNMIFIGHSRALDVLALELDAVMTGWPLKPGLVFVTESHSDPLPGNNNALDPVRWEQTSSVDRSAKAYAYGVSFAVGHERYNLWQWTILRKLQSYKEKVTSTDDHRDYRLIINWSRIAPSGNQATLELNVVQRTYLPHSREDYISDLFLGWRPILHEMLFLDMWTRLYLLTSSDSEMEFNRFDMGIGMGIVL